MRKITGVLTVISLRGGVWRTRVIIYSGRRGARTPDLTDVNHHAAAVTFGPHGSPPSRTVRCVSPRIVRSVRLSRTPAPRVNHGGAACET